MQARDDGADVALGSRYVPGGGTENWGRGRRLVSTGGSLYARTLLGVGIRDLTGGFKCFRREVLEAIDLDAIRSKGYAFQIETTYRAIRLGFGVAEVPILFADRTAGSSKMSRAIFLEAVIRVPTLRFEALTGRICARARHGRVRRRHRRRPAPRRLLGAVVPSVQGPRADPVRARGALPVAKLNVDEHPGIASRYDVLSIPTVILFAGGEAVGTLVGLRPRALRQVAIRSAPSPPRLDARRLTPRRGAR